MNGHAGRKDGINNIIETVGIVQHGETLMNNFHLMYSSKNLKLFILYMQKTC
jgi:hypothetical protein